MISATPKQEPDENQAPFLIIFDGRVRAFLGLLLIAIGIAVFVAHHYLSAHQPGLLNELQWSVIAAFPAVSVTLIGWVFWREGAGATAFTVAALTLATPFAAQPSSNQAIRSSIHALAFEAPSGVVLSHFGVGSGGSGLASNLKVMNHAAGVAANAFHKMAGKVIDKVLNEGKAVPGVASAASTIFSAPGVPRGP